MQTIRINGKEMKVSAGEERILRTLARSDFIAGKDNFVEGDRQPPEKSFAAR